MSATCIAPVLCLTLVGGPAFAQEAIRTGDGGAPVMASASPGAAGAQPDPETIGAWAQGVLQGAPAEPDERTSRQCVTAKADDAPRGAVWAGIGNHGYRQAGGVVTQPLGGCGSVTVMIDRTEGGYGHFSNRR